AKCAVCPRFFSSLLERRDHGVQFIPPPFSRTIAETRPFRLRWGVGKRYRNQEGNPMSNRISNVPVSPYAVTGTTPPAENTKQKAAPPAAPEAGKIPANVLQGMDKAFAARQRSLLDSQGTAFNPCMALPAPLTAPGGTTALKMNQP